MHAFLSYKVLFFSRYIIISLLDETKRKMDKVAHIFFIFKNMSLILLPEGTVKRQVGGWDVLRRCVPVRIFRDPWSTKWNVPETQCPCIYTSFSFAFYNTYRWMNNDRDVSMQGHCVSQTIYLGDLGSQEIHTGTHRSWTSHQITYRQYLQHTGRWDGSKVGSFKKSLLSLLFHTIEVKHCLSQKPVPSSFNRRVL